MSGIIARLRGKVGRTIAKFRSREDYIETFDFRSGLGEGAWCIWGLVRLWKPEVCVEIGSARGKSACATGLALRRNGMGKLYAIDPHCETDWNDTDSTKSYEIMLAHLARAGVTGFVEMIRTTSAEAASTWHRKIDILFIDGDHSYEGVKKDWELFSPHVSEFGIVVFHDTTWDLIRDGSSPYKRDDMGVPKFVEELRKSGYPIITANKDCGVSIVQPRIGGVALNHDQT